MKIRCAQENLNKGLGVVYKALPSTKITGATQNILFSAEDSFLTLTATDLEISISYKVQAIVDEPGSLSVKARTLKEMVDTLPNDVLYLERLPRNILGINHARTTVKFPGEMADNFPKSPTVEYRNYFTVKASTLRDAISRVVYAAASDQSRPALTGTHVQLKGKSARLVCADGFRIATSMMPLEDEVATPKDLLIPSKALIELGRLLDIEDAEIVLGNRRILIKSGNMEMIILMLADKFPEVDGILNVVPESTITVDTAEYSNVIRTAAIVARESGGIIKMIAKDNQMQVTAVSDETGEVSSSIDASIKGSDVIKVAMSATYISSMLRTFSSKTLIIGYGGVNSPVMFTPSDSDEYMSAIMPISTSW